MYRRCTLEKAVSTQIKYEECLIELMKEKPYSEITINHICDRMGTSRKSFYHFFKNKQGCLFALIDRLFYEFVDYQIPEHVDLKGYPPRLIRQMLYQLETREIMDLLIRNNLYNLLDERLVTLIKENARQSGTAPNTYEEDAIVFYLCGVMGIRYMWHISGYQRSIYEVADSILRLATPEMLENW